MSKSICENRRLNCLSEEAGQHSELLFPHPHGRRGFQPEISNRTVLEAVIYWARTGCLWRDLPKEYGSRHAIYMRWSRWVHAGIPQRVTEHIHAEQVETGEVDLCLVFLDSSVIRAHQHAAGARKNRSAGARTFSRRTYHKDSSGLRRRAPRRGVALTSDQVGDTPAGE